MRTGCSHTLLGSLHVRGPCPPGVRIESRNSPPSVRSLPFLASAVLTAAQAHKPQAIELNNRGVALMGQQFTERAAAAFADAFKEDPKLAQAAINDGIALLTLQKLDDAKKMLQQALRLILKAPRLGTTSALHSTPTTISARR